MKNSQFVKLYLKRATNSHLLSKKFWKIKGNRNLEPKISIDIDPLKEKPPLSSSKFNYLVSW
jgi:hypothetical protein